METSPAGWREWLEVSRRLEGAPGVHAPSAFSAVLAAGTHDLGGRVVLDVGSGAGLISIAALRGGADHVVALDRDPAALRATEVNVRRELGDAALSRLSLLQADYRQLGLVNADLALANPPQRPTGILGAVDPRDRHLHEGGGDDGLDSVRLILDNARCGEVWTTAAAVLPIAELAIAGWDRPRRLASAAPPMHPAWALLGPAGPDTVGVWSFRRSAAGHVAR